LSYALLCENYDIAKYLIEKGADTTITNNDGDNPLDDVDNDEFNEWFKSYQNNKNWIINFFLYMGIIKIIKKT